MTHFDRKIRCGAKAYSIETLINPRLKSRGNLINLLPRSSDRGRIKQEFKRALAQQNIVRSIL